MTYKAIAYCILHNRIKQRRRIDVCNCVITHDNKWEFCEDAKINDTRYKSDCQ